jgi:HNH endonuclease
MAHKAIPRLVRRLVRDRAGDCCEYCRHPASHSCAPFVCEHVVPRVLGARSTMAELAWACPACNGHKYAKTRAPDPQTGRTVDLLNPRRQRWPRHFAWSADLMNVEGRTATGRAIVVALHLNSRAPINLRKALRSVGEHPQRGEAATR